MAVPKSEKEFREMNIEEIEVVEESEKSKDGKTSFHIKETREDTRGRLAIYFVIGFFSVLVLTSIFAFFSPVVEGQSTIDNLREAVLTVSGVLSGPLGFIIGFYFRKGDE